MAVLRPTPTCEYCGEATAEGIYENQEYMPHIHRTMGDTFIRWEYKECQCKAAKKARKKLQESIDKTNFKIGW